MVFNPYYNIDDVSKDFRSLYHELPSFPTPNKEQLVIRKLCNKAKHFRRTEIEKQEKNDISVTGVMECGDHLGAYHYIYTVEIEGNDELLNEVLKVNLARWDKFIKENV